MTAYATLNRTRTTTQSLYCGVCRGSIPLTHTSRISHPTCSPACDARYQASWRRLTQHVRTVATMAKACLAPAAYRRLSSDDLIRSAMDALLERR